MGAFCRVALVVALAVAVGRFLTIPGTVATVDGPQDAQRQRFLAAGARNSTWVIYEGWSGDHATTPLYPRLFRAERLHRQALADPTIPKLRAARHAFDEVRACMNRATCDELIVASEEASHVYAFRASVPR